MRQNCSYTSPPAARHYHPTLSIWLSVDPMADKYPGVSPYTYCGNNPVKLVDPDGREIYLLGDAWQTAIAFLQKICPNIHLIVGEDGLLSYEVKDNVKYSRKGEAKLSSGEKLLCKIIDSRTICISFTVNNANEFQKSNGESLRTVLGGGFGGSEYNGNGTADAEQFVSMNYVYKYFDYEDIGDLILHEVTEAYCGAQISIDNKRNTCIPYVSTLDKKINCSDYDKAHNNAWYQPITRFEKLNMTQEKYDSMLKSIGDSLKKLLK